MRTTIRRETEKQTRPWLLLLASAWIWTMAACAPSSIDEATEDVSTTQQALNSASYVSGNQWYVNGSPYLMKGVNWDPSEPCEQYTQYNWNRAGGDATIMQANGFNTIRTYGFTSAKAGLPDGGYITSAQLDEFNNRGIKVILTVHSAPGDSTWTGVSYNGSNIVAGTGDFTQAAKDHINMYKAHPAVIAFGVGNEIDWNYFYTKDPGGAWTNGWTLSNVVNHANHVTNRLRALTDKPVTVSWGNTTHINSVGGLNSDIVSYQIYNTLSLDNVFNLHPQYSGKPFYISEFGSDAWNANIGGVDENAQRDGNRNLFTQILNNATTGAGGNANHKVVGGTVFSFSDGWWKAGNACTQESGGVAPGGGPYPDQTFNEEFWGLCRGDGQATRTCRSTIGDLRNLFAGYSSGGGAVLSAGGSLYNTPTEIRTPDGQNVARMQSDGNFCLYQGGQWVWGTQTFGQGANRVTLQTDGNLVVYDASNNAKWASGTNVGNGANLRMQIDGNLVLYRADGGAAWSSGTNKNAGSQINGPRTLYKNDRMVSADYRMVAILQTDGNFVVYFGGTPLWSTGTYGTNADHVSLQSDGNLVVYGSGNEVRWASNTNGQGGTSLKMQNDGNFVMYNASGGAVWATGTYGH